MKQTLPRPYSDGVENIKCDLCGSDKYKTVFQSPDLLLKVDKEVHTLVRCSQCGLLYVNPRPTAAEMPRYYPSSYEPYNAKTSLTKRIMSLVENRNARNIARLLEPGSTVVEIGCGTGELLQRIAQRGLLARGVENSPHAVARAKALGLDVYQGTLAEARLEDESVDAVILKHVIEHLPSPSSTLKEIRRVLKPGGYMVLWLPNGASLEARVFGRYWHGYDLPRHLFTFGPRTITELLDRGGFQVDRLSYSWVPNDLIRSLKHILALKLSFPTRAIATSNVLLLAAFTPVSVLLGLTRRSGRITVVAKKTAAGVRSDV